MKKQSGLRIASVRGIDLRIHLSLLFLLLYVMAIATIQFPHIALRAGIDPAALAGGSAAWALLFALGLFASIALHEFGHAFTAQALGIRVNGITLMMLGGVSEMEKIPDRPLAEFKLAIVGPLVSLGLAAGLNWAGSAFERPEPYFFCYWLARANFVLAIFNLLPAFPLDGGRALRSLLALRQGNSKATRTAVRISKTLAWALGLLGALSFNLLLVLIAFFVYTAANSELFLQLSQGWLRGVSAAEVGIRLEPLPSTTRLAQAVRRMLETRATVLPLEGGPQGVRLISLSDIRKAPRRSWGDLTVSDLAVEASRAIRLEDALSEILPELAAAPHGVLPIVNAQGAPIGVIRYSDVNDVIALKSATEAPESDRRAA
ncbi:MAG: site-2 protease family protein [Oligoflexia bacterium]|nr:site-2 protease family protein [Oligoflexia bacterium]